LFMVRLSWIWCDGAARSGCSAPRLS